MTVRRSDGVVFHAGDWVAYGDGKSRVEQAIVAFVDDPTDGNRAVFPAINGIISIRRLDDLTHCAPENLPELLPPGVEYGFQQSRWRVVEAAPFNRKVGFWEGGRDEFIGEKGGFDPGRAVEATVRTVDWSTYWAAVNGDAAAEKEVSALDWDACEMLFEEVLGELR